MGSDGRTFPAVLTGRRESGAGLTLVTLTPPRDLTHGYRAPGQYIEVRASAKGYFALAGEVGAPSWELLVRMNGGASDTLLSAREGTELVVSGPHGKGFPLEAARGRPLVVAVAGSAVAVARPILRERVALGEGPATHVYVGARTVKDVPLAQELSAWAHAGARVVLCLSRPAQRQDETPGLAAVRSASGYVQQVLANDVIEGLVREGVVFAAGPSGMLADVRALEPTKGATLEVYTNV